MNRIEKLQNENEVMPSKSIILNQLDNTIVTRNLTE